MSKHLKSVFIYKSFTTSYNRSNKDNAFHICKKLEEINLHNVVQLEIIVLGRRKLEKIIIGGKLNQESRDNMHCISKEGTRSSGQIIELIISEVDSDYPLSHCLNFSRYGIMEVSIAGFGSCRIGCQL